MYTSLIEREREREREREIVLFCSLASGIFLENDCWGCVIRDRALRHADQQGRIGVPFEPWTEGARMRTFVSELMSAHTVEVYRDVF
jgi:hypothetical protein